MEIIFEISYAVLWFLALANSLLLIALIRKVNQFVGHDEKMEFLPVGEPAPEFEARDLDGEKFTLADFLNKAIALIFVSAKCPSCVDTIAKIESWQSKAVQADVELVLVSLDDDVATRKMLNEFRVPSVVLIAPPTVNSFMQDYKVYGAPFYCFVNKEGQVSATGHFDHEWHQLISSWVPA